jgi:hypothetical protein
MGPARWEIAKGDPLSPVHPIEPPGGSKLLAAWLRIGEFARRKRFPVDHFANRMARVFAAPFFLL